MPTEPLKEGTVVERAAGFQKPGLTSIPYAVPGGSEKRVVASAALYSGIWKDEIVQARGMITGNLGSTDQTTQVLTRLILADSPSATTGETIGSFSGDKLPPSTQIHTSVKEGIHVMAAAEPVVKYVNFVVYASQANPSGSMAVEGASVYITRSKHTAPIDEGFEDGLDADGVDSVHEFELHGLASASSTVSREGSESLRITSNRTPIAAYSFNEGQGATVDDIFGNHDGAISGATWDSSGKFGSALSFDGVDDLVTIAEPDELDLTGPFTLSAWVRPDAFDEARPVISKVEFPEAGVGGYQLEGTSAGMPLGRVANSGAIKGVEGTEALSTDETWSHLALTSDGAILRLYVNGVLAKSGEGLTAADTDASLKIGSGFGGWFDGLIDEVRIYDEELSGEEIKADMSNPVDGANIRRTEVRPPNIRTAAGYSGEDSWHGFSVYFPEEFDAPGPDPIVYFHGLIDEVRLHDQALSESQIADEMAGNYGQNPTPAAAYDFDDGEGTTATDSAGSNDGMITGATWETNGKIGSALKFDGIGDEVTIPDAGALDLTDSFTLEAWVRPEEVSAWTGTPVIDKLDDPASSKSGYLLRAAASGSRPTGLVASSGTVANSYGSSPLELDEWTHLALASTGSQVTLYVNGQPTQTTSAFKVPATSSDLTIGSSRFNTATRGPWNFFSQFHGTTLGKQELGCPQNPNGVPIAFNVRHYQANDYTNPGESETATPVEGDYIEVIFRGGEIEADCLNAVNEAFKYILGPLEKERWYDFVLHTRWTHLEGSEGNSVSEVWMDRDKPGTLQQVLGNETVPVTQPNLSWRLTPDMHTTDAYWQTGLYRGGTLEDPKVTLFLDAIRSGNSCSDVAPGQPAGDPCND